MSPNDGDPVPEIMEAPYTHGSLDPQQARPYKGEGKIPCYTCTPKTLACAKLDSEIGMLREDTKFNKMVASGSKGPEHTGPFTKNTKVYFPKERVEKAKADYQQNKKDMQSKLNKRKRKKCKGRGDLEARKLLHDKSSQLDKSLEGAGKFATKEASSMLMKGANWAGKKVGGFLLGNFLAGQKEIWEDDLYPAYGVD